MEKKKNFIFEEYKTILLIKKNFNRKKLNIIFSNITTWANTHTKNLEIPKELKNLKLYNDFCKKRRITYVHIFFKYLYVFLKKKFSLKNSFLFHALKRIQNFINKIKKNTLQLEFSDLEKIIKKKIIPQKEARQFLRKKHQIAFIDEFQDVSYQQYSIFSKIYREKKNCSLTLIGDPKQSIYSFQGSNLLSYIKVRSSIKKVYNLNTNWRSSKNMIESINKFFSQSNNPFLYKKLFFLKSKNPNVIRSCSNFKIKGIVQTALKIFFVSKTSITLEEYRKRSADKCAANINYWIKKGIEKKAVLFLNGRTQFLKEKDIVVLVRNKYEAIVIQQSLKKLNIKSQYFSQKKNIFFSLEANNLLNILQCILNPNNKENIHKTIMSDIFSNNFLEVYNMKNDKKIFFTLLKTIFYYKSLWKNFGIYCLIKKIVSTKIIFNINLKNTNSIKKYFQLGEILEKKYCYFKSKSLLISWFFNKIMSKNVHVKEKYLEQKEIKNCINIMSIHQSKGLEFPITWIPFGISFSKINSYIFYDTKKNSLSVNLEKKKEYLNSLKKEQLSEEIRLLYVALTRSILHCSISISPIRSQSIKNNINLKNSGVGYLLQNGKNVSSKKLFELVKKIDCHPIITVTEKNNFYFANRIETQKNYDFSLKISKFTRKRLNIWKIYSYTSITKTNKNKNETNLKVFPVIKTSHSSQFLNSYTFPRGKENGKFLHLILKKNNFSYGFNKQWMQKQVEETSIEKCWISPLTNWMNSIVQTPILEKSFILSELKKDSYQKEFEFFIPVYSEINKNKFINLFNNTCNTLKENLNVRDNITSNYLHGFIDIVIMYGKKFYILEYKSNWLGEKNENYSVSSIKNVIRKKNYNIQHTIYTLAIHRYLKIRVPNYKYSTHFGGVIYMFIRAIDNLDKTKNNGIFYVFPSFSIVNKLDKLLLGKHYT